jgi:hypothetical protein
MSHSWVAAASEICGLPGLAPEEPVGALVAEADPVVEPELPVGFDPLPQAVRAAAAKAPASSSVLRAIQRRCGIGTSRVDIVGIESATVCAVRPVCGRYRRIIRAP